MLEPRLITTSMAIAAVIARDAADRDGQPAETLESIEVIAAPTGKVWGFNDPAGPLDGQPEMRYSCEARYDSGRMQVWATVARGQ